MSLDPVSEEEINRSFELEEVFDVDAYDGKKIWCILNKADDTLSDKAIILCHGLTGQAHEYLHMIARDYFNERGYDVYRIALYNSGDGYRLLRDCTLDIHAKDLKSLTDHIHDRHDKIFICGHSYGGMTMLVGNPQATAISFWDSSFNPWDEFWKDQHEDYYDEIGFYTIGWSSKHFISPDMFEEAKAISYEKSKEMASNITGPAQVVYAENMDHENRKKIYDHLTCEKDLQCIKGAGHCFWEGKTVYDLVEKTYQWFERF